MSEKLTFFGTSPFLEESIKAIEQAYLLDDIKLVRGKLTNDILKHPGPGMRKRTAGEIIRRFITYNRKTGKIDKDPLLTFVASNFTKAAKLDVLYYQFIQVHPIVKATLGRLKLLRRVKFTKNELVKIVSNLVNKSVNSSDRGLRNILYSLQDYGLIVKNQTNIYQINEKHLAKVTFIFLLYQHFLSKGAVAPKTLEVRKFFNDVYNQPEKETTQMLLSYGDGFWVVERAAHLDQILLAYSNMDEFMKKFLEIYGR